MRISDLRDAAGLAETVADRGWHAWWQDSGVSLAEYGAGIAKLTTGAGIPLGLVAQEDGRYLGSVLLIENDLASRPGLGPWIAALWVEPEARRRGIAAALIDAARARAAALGHARCHLCAAGANAPYYLARGFRRIERDVEGLDVFVI